MGYIYDTLNHLTKYPIIGTGIGTWKIYSTEYISKDKATYEAPYHAHNDFLQIFAETGILGGFFYLMVFLCVPATCLSSSFPTAIVLSFATQMS